MEKFTKLNEKLRKVDTNIINSTEKIFFAYIIGWQENGLKLTASNQTIGNELGMSKEGIRTLIKKCNKFFGFFTSKQTNINKKDGDFNSDHIIQIDMQLFEKFLDNPIKPIRIKKEASKEVSKSVTPKVEVIVQEPTEEVVTEEIPSTIDDLLEFVDSCQEKCEISSGPLFFIKRMVRIGELKKYEDIASEFIKNENVNK
jgi:hypothetical protein